MPSNALTIRVEGLDDLKRKMALLVNRVRNKVVSQGLRAGAQPILQEALKRVPVKSGALRASLKIRVNPEKRRSEQSIAVLTGKGFFRGETYYGGFVHFGHRIGRRSAGILRLQSSKSRARGRNAKLLIQKRIERIDTRKRVPAHPFLFQAYDARRDQAATIARDSIVAGINREVDALGSTGGPRP